MVTLKQRIFISHASEDKVEIARPLATELQRRGFDVWFDEFEMQIGDSIRRKIEEALASCDYGIVILSHHFFEKEWPQRELDGLASREVAGEKKLILPVWHQIGKEDILKYSPVLADRIGVPSNKGVNYVADQIVSVVKEDDQDRKESSEKRAKGKSRSLLHSFTDPDDYGPDAWWVGILNRIEKEGCPECGEPIEFINQEDGGTICENCGWDIKSVLP